MGQWGSKMRRSKAYLTFPPSPHTLYVSMKCVDTSEMSSPVLFVRGLPPHIGKADIENAFAHYDFVSAQVVRIDFTFLEGLSACVKFESTSQVELAIQTMHSRPFPDPNPQVLFNLSLNPPTTAPAATYGAWPHPVDIQNGGSTQTIGREIPCVRPVEQASANSQSTFTFSIATNAGLEDTHNMCHPLNTILEQMTKTSQPMTGDSVAKKNIFSPGPPDIASSLKETPKEAVKPLQPATKMGGKIEPQTIIPDPPVHPIDTTLTEADPSLTTQPNVNADPHIHTESDVLQEDLSTEVPGTWYGKKPVIAGKTTSDIWTGLLGRLPSDEICNLPIYVSNTTYKIGSLQDKVNMLQQSLRIEQDKTATLESRICDIERRHQEEEKRQQEETKNAVKKLDTRYAAYQQAELAVHEKKRQEMQAAHQAQLDAMAIELESIRMNNSELKNSLDEHTITNQTITLQRDSLKTSVAELKEELGQVQSDATATRADRDRWHQSFIKVNAALTAKETEHCSLNCKLKSTLREMEMLKKEVKHLRIQESKHKLKEIQWGEAEENRKKEEEMRRNEREKEKKRLEEERRENERRLQEEEKRREEERQRLKEEKLRIEAERERQAKEAAAKEERALEDAAVAEEKRCRKRDTLWWGNKPWTAEIALERFHLVMIEFTSSKYSPMEPVTTRSIPWPTLLEPGTLTLDMITWENVEAFLRHMKKTSLSDAAHMKVLKQVQLMFHPDRWRSRNILLTVIDDKLRGSLEHAGKIVSQAVNQWIDKNGGGNRAAR